jgi:hypothetical protein
MTCSRGVALAMAIMAPAVQAASRPTTGIEVTEASISELQAALAGGKVTSRQLVSAYRARIAAYDQDGPALNSIVTLNPAALAEADALDRERAAKGPRGPLHGIPVLVKDNFDTRGMPTSGGALALATIRFSYEPTTARLRADVTASGTGKDAPIAVALHRSHEGGAGPVLAPMMMRGQQHARVDLVLDGLARADLTAGQLYVELYTPAAPLGAGRASLIFKPD